MKQKIVLVVLCTWIVKSKSPLGLNEGIANITNKINILKTKQFLSRNDHFFVIYLQCRRSVRVIVDRH